MSVESYDSTTDVKNTPIYNSVPTNDQDYKPRVVTWWGIGTLQPFLITGGAISAGLIALSHHFFDSYLERRYVDGFWDQTMSRRTENAFATVFQILFVFSAGISLCQVSWYTIRRTSFRVRDLDALISPPSIATLFHLKLLLYAPLAFIITLLIFASPVVSIFAPSLTLRSISMPSKSRVDVPIINASLAWDPDANMGISVGWGMAIAQALATSTRISWPIPPGCAPACDYALTYTGPAVECTQLSSDHISNGSTVGNGIEPVAYVNITNDAIMNFTRTGSDDTAYAWTVAYLNWNTQDEVYVPEGATCTAYGAIYYASISYSNGSQKNVVSPIEPLNRSLNTTYPSPPRLSFDPIIGELNFDPFLVIIMDVISNYLTGVVYLPSSLDNPPRDSAGPLAAHNSVLQLNRNGTSVVLGKGIANLSQGLTDLVTNVTLNLMNAEDLSVSNVTSGGALVLYNVYAYSGSHLIITYGVGFVLLLAISAAGLHCLIANGVPSSNRFSQILATTRNPSLDDLVKSTCLGNGTASKNGMGGVRLRFGEVGQRDRGGERHAAFGVVDCDEISPLKSGYDYL